MPKRLTILAMTLLVSFAMPLASFPADKLQEAEQTVAAARETLSDFLTDPSMSWFKGHLDDAKGVLIIPEVNKGGFIFAGSGGVGVLLTRDSKGRWSCPAFYRLGSVSVGLQIGGERSEVVLLVQSNKGVDSFLSSKVQLGGDVSVAAGPVGQGAKAATADVLSFSRSKGAFVGASLEGTVVKPADDLNAAFYGESSSPVDILVRREAKNAKALPLQEDLAKAYRAAKP